MLRDELDGFNIFALREYARRTGVKSPTSKRKDELINEIMDIVEGKKLPNMTSKFGRPPKEFKADAFGFRSQCDNSTFNQDFQSFDYSVFKEGKVTGYLEQNNNNFVLNILVDGKVLAHFVPYELSNKYDFRAGDQLCVTLSKKGGNVVIDEIISVNGVSPNNFNNLRPNFVNLKHQFSNELLAKYHGKDLTILPGDIIYIRGMSNINNSLQLIDILNNSTKTKNIYFNISLVNKTMELLERLNTSTSFTASFTDSEDYMIRLTNLMYEHIQRLVESGYDVLVGIDDLLSIEKLPDGAHLCREILSLAKNTSECGSVSLIAIMPNDNSLNMYDKLCDKTYWAE